MDAGDVVVAAADEREEALGGILSEHATSGEVGLEATEALVRGGPLRAERLETDAEVEVVRDGGGVFRAGGLAARTAVHAIQDVVRRLAHRHHLLPDHPDVVALRGLAPPERLARGEGVVQTELLGAGAEGDPHVARVGGRHRRRGDGAGNDDPEACRRGTRTTGRSGGETTRRGERVPGEPECVGARDDGSKHSRAPRGVRAAAEARVAEGRAERLRRRYLLVHSRALAVTLIKNIFPRRSFRGGDCEAPQTERAEDRAHRRHTAPARTPATRRRARSTATGASTLTSRRSSPSSGASSRLSATSWATPRLPVPVADPLASSRFPSRHSPRAAHSAPPRRRPASHVVSPSTWPSPR